MANNKKLLPGSTSMLLLRLLEDKDMYGYEMIEELEKRSKNTFSLKAGTLYPLLHDLEKKELINSYTESADNSRVRKYYTITNKGKGMLKEKKEEWNSYSFAINQILQGGCRFCSNLI
jgi:DNA-binding PadR family transcriptional regulator